MKPLQIFIISSFIISMIIIVTALTMMPDNVAQHFGGSGVPDSIVSKTTYLIFMIVFCVGVPAFMYFAIGVLPRKFPKLTNIPNRDYWLAEDRIDTTLETMKRQGITLIVFTQLFMLGVHLCLIEANSRNPVRLNENLFWILMAVFIVGILFWSIRLMVTFRKPAA